MRKILAISKTRPQDTRSYTHIHIHGSGSLLPRMRDTFYRNLSFWWILNPLYHTRTCKESRECVCQVFKVLSLAASRCKTRIMLFYWKWKSLRGGKKTNKSRCAKYAHHIDFYLGIYICLPWKAGYMGCIEKGQVTPWA